MSNIKKLLFVVCFVLLTLVAPTVIMLFFINAAEAFYIYLIVYILILFAILGYVVSRLISIEKKMDSFFEDIRKQNAAIAYKILANGDQGSQTPAESTKTEIPATDASVDTTRIKLNPDDPLIPSPKKKTVDEGFDDFK